MVLDEKQVSRKDLLQAGSKVALGIAAAGALASVGQPGAAFAASARRREESGTTLTALFPGNAPSGWSQVLSAVNTKLQADGLGFNLQVIWVPWSDFQSVSLLKINAGGIDMWLDATWAHMLQLLANGAIEPWDKHLAKAPNLVKSIPKAQFAANMYPDSTGSYVVAGIPLGIVQGTLDGLVIRGDLRKKYGLAPLKTQQDIINFLYAVKKNENGKIIPFGIDQRQTTNFPLFFSPWTYNSKQYRELPPGNSINPAVWVDELSGEVVPGPWAPNIMAAPAIARKFHQDGIMEPNPLAEQNTVPYFNNGKFAAVQYQADGAQALEYLPLLQNVKGAEMEFVLPYDTAQPHPNSDYKQWNFLCMAKNSPNIDKIVALQDWLSIKVNHDLLEYGIPGKDWTPVGSDAYTPLTKYAFPGYVTTWRPALHRVSSIMLPDDKKWFKYCWNANNFVRSKLAGFNFNATPVKSAYDNFSAVATDLTNALNSGEPDPTDALKKLRAAWTSNGGAKIVAAYKTQLADYKASQK